MDRETKEGITQVLDVIKHTDKNVVDKISKSFIEFLENNKESDYEVNIDYTNEDWINQINEEAKIILALIYRDFLVSEDEREKLIVNEKKIDKLYQEELSKKYNTEELFKNINNTQENIKEGTSLIEIQEKKWYQKLLAKIISIFGKK